MEPSQFLITDGGGHLCTNDTFKVLKLKAWRAQIYSLKKVKAYHVAGEKIQEEALVILKVSNGDHTSSLAKNY